MKKMELKEAQDELTKLRLSQELKTIEFTKRVFGKHLTRLDLSNHFFFDRSTNFLIKLLITHFSNNHSLKSLILQNCNISQRSLLKLLKLLFAHAHEFKFLDLSNNRLSLEPDLSHHLSKLFTKTSKPKSLSLQGNICTNSEAFTSLFSKKIYLLELNLYDTNLSAESLLVISQALIARAQITNFNLGFNAQAFEDVGVVKVFAHSISQSQCIEELNLSGNDSLGIVDNLSVLSEGIKGNRSLTSLKLGAINLEDFGVSIITNLLLRELPIFQLDLQNNSIQDAGFKALVQELTPAVTVLDVSYNNFKDVSSLVVLSRLLLETKSLRKLIISHSFELESFESSALDLLCESLVRNDSLAEFLCEGVKLPCDPDVFCSKLRRAIAIRKLSLVYKISAVHHNITGSVIDSIRSNENSMKFVSIFPSNLSGSKDKDSAIQRNQEVESPDEEPIENHSEDFEETPIDLAGM